MTVRIARQVPDSVPDGAAGGKKWVHFWGDPLPCDDSAARDLLGSKALSLALLARLGLPTPPAFTITSEACREYHASGQLPPGLWPEVRAALARLESAVGRSFGKAPQPLTVAIRGGATESMPGALATFLHCGLSEKLARQIDDETTWEAFAEFLEGYAYACLGGAWAGRVAKELSGAGARVQCQRWLREWATSAGGPLSDDPEVILRSAIEAVFDSWRGEGAASLRKLLDVNSSAGTSVTIQAMFTAAISGVAFSREPNDPQADELIVEAAVGSGRRLLAGQSTPHRWIVNRRTLAVGHLACEQVARVTADASFVDRILPQLCRDVLAIEAQFEQPVDVEFGYAAGEVVFFQARPVKPALEQARVERARSAERVSLVALAKEGRRLWVRHNLADTLPAPTPLTWDLWRAFMTGKGGLGRLYRRLGYRPSKRVRRAGFLELVAGRIYADPERLSEMLCSGYPLCFDQGALRRDPDVLNRPPDCLDLEQLDPWFLVRWPSIAFTILRAGWLRPHLSRTAIKRFDRDIVPRIRSLVDAERQIDLTRLSPEELVDVFRRRRPAVFDEFAPECLLPGTLGVAAWNLLQQALSKSEADSERRGRAEAILSAISDPVADRQRALLSSVARGDASVGSFLDEFGHRGPGEMDLSSPRWREIPDAVLASARRRSNPALLEPRPSVDEACRILDEATRGKSHRLSGLAQQSLALLPYREIGKHEWMRAYELLREIVLELARRTRYGEGIHFLTVSELEDLPQERDQSQLIARRRDHHRACRKLSVPDVLELDDDLENFGRPARLAADQSIVGTPLVPGQALGRVLLLNGQEPREPVAERVIVASALEPVYVPLLADSAAFLLERGGILSHVALLARQLAIPTVVVEGITRHVVDGELVFVDAGQGLVERGFSGHEQGRSTG
ncbi:MAG TPA: PEP/pyruvate-binding domain-containing protein [Pirellulales bacterium]|nr:PEP/pyruvate-binding domain-containing protein [Pirellulales bacterium]